MVRTWPPAAAAALTRRAAGAGQRGARSRPVRQRCLTLRALPIVRCIRICRAPLKRTREGRGRDETRVVLVLIALILAGCASLEARHTRDLEQVLTDAGFQMRAADSPEALAYLQTLPARKMLVGSANAATRGPTERIRFSSERRIAASSSTTKTIASPPVTTRAPRPRAT